MKYEVDSGYGNNVMSENVCQVFATPYSIFFFFNFLTLTSASQSQGLI